MHLILITRVPFRVRYPDLSPFDRELVPSNRWVVLAHLIPWGEICGIY
ncbi:MAG: hypothetical protein LBL57_03360 [Tannerella sp.]|nr:hypothetical protein [Tannerella sp.]